MAEKTFKVGQRVRIAEKLMRYSGDPGIDTEMRNWEGKTVTIAGGGGEYYRIEEDNRYWSWGDRWLIPLSDELIEIQGESATLYQIESNGGNPLKKMERKVAVADLLEKIASERIQSDVIETPILSAGSRYYLKNGDFEAVIIERVPAVASVNLTSDGYEIGATNRMYRLAMPYVIFILYLYKGRMVHREFTCSVFFQNEPFTSLDAPLSYAPLPNVYTIEPWCSAGCLEGLQIEQESPLNDKIASAVNYFWSSGFTGYGDQSTFVKRNPDSRISTLEKWERNSKQDPLFVLNIPWESSGRSARQIIQRVKNRHAGTAIGTSERVSNVSQLADIMYRLKEVE
jgi:hypothetical protein